MSKANYASASGDRLAKVLSLHSSLVALCSVYEYKLIQIDQYVTEIDERRGLRRVVSVGQRGGKVLGLRVGGVRAHQASLHFEEGDATLRFVGSRVAAERQAVGASDELGGVVFVGRGGEQTAGQGARLVEHERRVHEHQGLRRVD